MKIDYVYCLVLILEALVTFLKSLKKENKE